MGQYGSYMDEYYERNNQSFSQDSQANQYTRGLDRLDHLAQLKMLTFQHNRHIGKIVRDAHVDTMFKTMKSTEDYQQKLSQVG